ncbi:MAG: DUF3078 domain-containing protein [Bacteroidales bacterium]|nr:MAG: DUF3078 domain-containing protein [Bacteroidales bacterium]
MKKVILLLLFCGNILILTGQADTLGIESKDTVSLLFPTDTLPGQGKISYPDTIDYFLQYLKAVYEDTGRWINPADSLRYAIGRLLDHIENEPVEWTISYLRAYPFESIEEPPSVDVMEKDTMVRISDDAIPGIISRADSAGLDSLAIVIDSLAVPLQDTTISRKTDSIFFLTPDSIPSLSLTLPETDTVKIIVADREDHIFNDTIKLATGDRIRIPFTDFSVIGSMDSLAYAVDLLIDYIEKDSIQVWLKNLGNDSTSVWMKNKRNYIRFWLKNEVMDSIGVWVENESKNSLKFILDDGVYFRKLGRSEYTEEYLNTLTEVKGDLQQMVPLKIKPQAWKYGGLATVNFAQGYLSNWAKGGESTISTLTEIELFSNYSRNNTKWDNNIRFKYGLIKSGEKRLRKNEDLFEISSKFGQKAFGKLGQHAIERYGTEGIKNWYYSLLVSFKSQVAKGYNYPNDSVVASKFMAPGYLIFSLGLDYKPNKETSILISPVTSKSTYVLDTVLIDQTKYGIAGNKRVYHEMGAYVKTRFLYNFNDDISAENKLDLFTNYTHNPQNIDIDWEIVLRMKITYYLTATISTHLIYDDDINVPIYDKEGIKIGAGPRLQFKEMLTIGFAFKF